MKVLFVPLPEISHIIPLLSLWRRLRGTAIESAFLVARRQHELVRRLGAEVLDLDHVHSFDVEMEAYRRFAPDVVVDDGCLSTWYATQRAGLPRVTLQRTGMFPGAAPRDPRHRHSMGTDIMDILAVADLASAGLPLARTLSDLFAATIHIVPGAPSVEVLPPGLREDDSYRFSGPLHFDDVYIESRADFASPWERREPGAYGALARFFEVNRGRRTAFVTLGTVEQPGAPIYEGIRRLLDRGLAVVASFAVPELAEGQREAFFHAFYLPMGYVCSRCDLMIHHCGSGTYHYPILHGLPAVTVGTECHDRDDIAVRLQELGVSLHIDLPHTDLRFPDALAEAVGRIVDTSEGSREERQARSRALLTLKDEVEQTSAAFDFPAILEEAVARFRSGRVAAAGPSPAVITRSSSREEPAIYYLCPDVTTPVGGVKQMYRHVDILNRNGFSASILHRRRGVRCTWFENETRTSVVSDSLLRCPWQGDNFLVLPEILGPGMGELAPGAPKVIFNQNAYYTFHQYSIEEPPAGVPYLHPEVLGAMVVSEDNADYLRFAFPRLDVSRVHCGIDTSRFRYSFQKKDRIAFLTTKNPADIAQVLNLLWLRGSLEGYEVVGIQGRSEAEMAEILGETAIFLSFSNREGFFLPSAEAMACGCIVAGYDGGGGREYLRPELSYPVADGDIRGFVETVEQIIHARRSDPAQVEEQARAAARFVADNYSLAREESDVTSFWRDLTGRRRAWKAPGETLLPGVTLCPAPSP